jgi:hypothetical protein
MDRTEGRNIGGDRIPARPCFCSRCIGEGVARAEKPPRKTGPCVIWRHGSHTFCSRPSFSSWFLFHLPFFVSIRTGRNFWGDSRPYFMDCVFFRVRDLRSLSGHGSDRRHHYLFCTDGAAIIGSGPCPCFWFRSGMSYVRKFQITSFPPLPLRSCGLLSMRTSFPPAV